MNKLEGSFEKGARYGCGYRCGGGWRAKKLNLPVFNASNHDGWIIMAERFFRFYLLWFRLMEMLSFGINGSKVTNDSTIDGR